MKTDTTLCCKSQKRTTMLVWLYFSTSIHCQYFCFYKTTELSKLKIKLQASINLLVYLIGFSVVSLLLVTSRFILWWKLKFFSFYFFEFILTELICTISHSNLYILILPLSFSSEKVIIFIIEFLVKFLFFPALNVSLQ